MVLWMLATAAMRACRRRPRHDMTSLQICGSLRSGTSCAVGAPAWSTTRRYQSSVSGGGVSSSFTQTTPVQDQDGAWTLLAALEKAREAEGVRVSRLVSSLEALLPRPSQLEAVEAMMDSGGAHMPDLSSSAVTSHTSDPAFFKLPDPQNPSGADIANMLRSARRGRRLDLSTVESLLSAAAAKFRESSHSIVTLPPLSEDQKLHVIGDLHGCLSDLEAVLGVTGEPNADNLLLFNGDFADRGDNGIEIISMVCALSLAYPNFVHVNRGNHEDLALSVAYGLVAEIQFKYGSGVFRDRLAHLLDGFFMALPLATVVRDDAFIVHAGPPPPGMQLSIIQDSLDGCGLSRTIRTKTKYNEINWGKDEHFKSLTAQDHAVEETLESMLWSDPDIDEFNGTLSNYDKADHATPVWIPNTLRGAGYRFDAQTLRRFMSASRLKRFIRSHEPVQNGCMRYEIVPDGTPSGEHQGEPLEFFTVFSASRYPYKEGFNYGAVLTLNSGAHKITRFATDDDEPLQGVAEIKTTDERNLRDQVDAKALRRSLRAALATRRSTFEKELEYIADWRGEDIESLPFDDAIDALFYTLDLRGEGMLQDGPRRALALALQPDLAPDELPITIDFLGTLDSFEEEDLEYECSDFGLNNSSWLQAVFALIDASHEGWISKEKWQSAVATVNSNLPPGSEEIDANEMWNLLDQDGDGRLSASEWKALGLVMCR